MTLTEQELREYREYADSLCLVQHGGTVPGNLIRKLLLIIESQKSELQDLRMPMVAQPERE